MDNYLNEELKDTKRLFNLDEILLFQLIHDMQIIRGNDFMYMCYIDNNVYSTALTPLMAIVNGIKIFKDLEKNN